MSPNIRAHKERVIKSIRLSLVAAIVVAIFIVGFAAGTAFADMRLPSSPIGQPPVISMQRVVATPIPPPTPAPRVTHTPRPRVASAAPASGRCGGDLPPCWVMMRESRGDPEAYNPTGCNGRGCFGKWQCDPRTCDGTGTEAEQDAEARRIWDNGNGCSHWAAC